MDKQAITKPIVTDAIASDISTVVSSKTVNIEYEIIAVNTFACFPQLIVEGMCIDGIDV